MAEMKKADYFSKYKNLIGDAQDTIRAIQNFISDNSDGNPVNMEVMEEDPAASVNRVLNSTACDDTNSDIQKIIRNL